MKKIPLTKGKFAIVDDKDYEWLSQWKWFYGGRGYACRWIKRDGKRKMIRMHRQIIQTPEKLLSDHINGNKLDNRRKNLRICTASQNSMNTKKRTDNKSGIRGVYWDAEYKKWLACIYVKSKRIYLGRFKNRKQAVESRKQGELKHFGKFARV